MNVQIEDEGYSSGRALRISRVTSGRNTCSTASKLFAEFEKYPYAPAVGARACRTP